MADVTGFHIVLEEEVSITEGVRVFSSEALRLIKDEITRVQTLLEDVGTHHRGV